MLNSVLSLYLTEWWCLSSIFHNVHGSMLSLYLTACSNVLYVSLSFTECSMLSLCLTTCSILSLYLRECSMLTLCLTCNYRISIISFILQMTDWESLIPTVSRLVCEDEVSGLAVNKKYIICQFWIQPEIAVFSRYSLELVRYGNIINWHRSSHHSPLLPIFYQENGKLITAKLQKNHYIEKYLMSVSLIINYIS